MTKHLEGDHVNPWSPCAAFDFNGDNDVDLLDFGAFQHAFQKPIVCTQPTDEDGKPTRIWVGAAHKFQGGGAIGARAVITPHDTIKLCGEPTAGANALSFVYVGVTTLGQTGKAQMWAQIGYRKNRQSFPPYFLMVEGISAECVAHLLSPDGYDIVIAGGVGLQEPTNTNFPWVGLPNATHVYKCSKTHNESKTWHFHVTNILLHSFQHSLWADVSGDRLDSQGELLNYQDDLVGTDSDKCNFTEIRYKTEVSSGSYGWRPAPYAFPADKDDPDPVNWGVERVSSTHIRIWDKAPLP